MVLVAPQADVLINPVNQSLRLDAGQVSSTLAKMAGQELQDECYENAPYGIIPGEIMWTSAYKLPFQKVYHCCIPGYNGSSVVNIQSLGLPKLRPPII